MKQLTTRPRVATYARVSTAKQDTRDPWASLSRQVEDMRETARRLGYAVALEVEEQGSGAKADRPGWARVLEAARAGEVDVIMAVAFDRLTRSEQLGDFEALKRELRGLGVRLATVKQGEMDLSGSADAEMLSDVQAVWAKGERLKIRERTMRGRREKAKAGGYTGHQPPYGYVATFDADTGDRRFAVDNQAAAVVRGLFDAFVAGASYNQLAVDLNARAVAPPRAHRRDHVPMWRPSTVRLMLRNPTYAGLSSWGVRRGGEAAVASTAFPAIVERATWEAAGAEQGVRAKRRPRGPAAGEAKPLSGILRCSSCGRGMAHQPGSSFGGRADGNSYKNPDTYVCQHAGARSPKPCGAPQHLNRQVAEFAVLAYLQAKIPAYIEGEMVAAHARQRSKRAAPDPAPAFEKRIAGIKAKQSGVLDMLLDEKKAALHPALEAKLGELAGELKAAEMALAEARKATPSVAAIKDSRKAMRGVADLLAGWDGDAARLRLLFDAAILQVILVKTSPARARQVLEVERLQLRNKDWL